MHSKPINQYSVLRYSSVEAVITCYMRCTSYYFTLQYMSVPQYSEYWTAPVYEHMYARMSYVYHESGCRVCAYAYVHSSDFRVPWYSTVPLVVCTTTWSLCTIVVEYKYQVLYSENMRRDEWNLTYVWGGIIVQYFELKFQRFEVNPDL